MSFGPRPWQQLHWDTRAAANFILGGTGSGLIMAWALAAQREPGMRVAIAAGLILIAAGLTAVWFEIGRKLRAAHVLFNPRTSWMTRESYVAVIVFASGGAALVLGNVRYALVCALAALAFAWCQGRILRASKGIPAWREESITTLVMTTALVEGAGLLAMAQALLGAVGASTITVLAIALVARGFAWSWYRARIGARVPRRTLDALDPAGKVLLQLGTVVPIALLIVAYGIPAVAQAGAALAGFAALFAGWRFKYVLVTRAAFNQGFSLPQLPVRGVAQVSIRQPKEGQG